jgi:diguanylate cyclase (GGDEF)-like protein
MSDCTHFASVLRSVSRPAIATRLMRIALLWLIALHAALVGAADLASLPAEPLGRWLDVMSEKERPLTIEEAQEHLRRGSFTQGKEEVLKFGIGAPPVWLHLAIENDKRQAVERRLQIENSWLDRIDVYVVQEGKIIQRLRAGDAEATAQHPQVGLGYVFELKLPPGRSELMVRVSTPDPLLVPVRLLDAEQIGALAHQYDYGYGLLYGFLLALIAYNSMLYIGLRERSYLDYTLYLGSFTLLNLSYTGHGYVWLWPGNAALQQYAIPLLMVIFGCLGLRFADGFLDLRRHEPNTHRLVRWTTISSLLVVCLAIVAQRQSEAVLFAFIFVFAFSMLMVWLGLVAVRHGRVAGRYFLAAALTSMLGNTATALAVWFGLTYSPQAFHAAGWGVVAEGILLALALAYRMRQDQRARLHAEHLARTDPLTGLLNRRAFLELAIPLWNNAKRNRRPLSAMMVDIDFFKKINDTHGHAMGDKVLQAVSGLLAEACRSSDFAARWGGEEFIILLPETCGEQAAVLAERLRTRIEEMRLGTLRKPIQLSASFGIAERGAHESLDQLINDADEWLYRAKEAGRNRVSGFSVAPF